MSGAAYHKGESKQNFRTPDDFRRAVVARFGPIAFDLAADESNQFCEKRDHYFSIEHNSLVHAWHEIPGTLWLNPEFSRIEPWAQKCAEEAKLGARILLLTPASVGSEWFAMHVWRKAFVLGLTGRLHFMPDHPQWGYPKDCVLSCYNFGVGFDLWKWK